MIAANKEFIDSVDEAITKVGELAGMLAGLEDKHVQVTITTVYEYIGTPPPDIGSENIVRTVRYVQEGGGETVAPAVQQVREEQGGVERVFPAGVQPVIEEATGGGGFGNYPDVEETLAANKAAESSLTLAEAQKRALQDLINQYDAGIITSRQFIAAQKELTSSQFMESNMAARAANAARAQADADKDAAVSSAELADQIRSTGLTADETANTGFAAMTDAMKNIENTNLLLREGFAGTSMALIAMQGAEAKEAGDSSGFQGAMLAAAAIASRLGGNVKSAAASLSAIPLATGLASFGITSLGTAIHLVVMGVAEFLAVFLPAMYAAAAGAYVMMQGVQLVGQHLEGLYTATEALGPMMNTTAGDMLGLGHSIQTAQDLANPGVFELFGESIGAIDAFSGRATLGLNGLKLTATGAAGGLTSFAQVGLDVAHMLDTFGAKVVADLQGPLGGTLHQLVSSATDDLRAFGQILGNLGHAIINLAADMPGLAEVVLHVIAGITALINWVSQLPHGLIEAIMVIEEMYRWSGLLAGAFSLLGRGIALIGTLGIPVFLAIGRNVATMAANVVAGVSNMVGNFGMLLSKVGLIGDEGVQNIARFRNVLATMVTFLGGPWGIALGLAVVAAGAFIFALSRMKTATQEWIDTAQQAVSKASNLQVLNVIAQQMQASSQKIADANNQIQRTQSDLADSQLQSAAASKQVGSSYSDMVQDINKASMAEQGYQVQRQKSNIAIDQAQTSINQLRSYQQQLVMDDTHVLEGASQISKAYGVDFVTALGLADMAGVKLDTSIGKGGELTAQAAIQIGAMVLGYQKMDQTGGILANSMNAVNIQAGLQASKVSQLNQSWDQFIAMSTSLTGSFTQFNLDLAQMGNQAQVVGSKINAFTGTTAQSVARIAASLKSFGTSSAQTWQAYNASITQANSFTDSLRIAAAAGVVSQTQYKEAIASVVGQLLPYASQSHAALAELEAIAQEAGGPAYTSTKNLSGNYQELKSWTDQNAVSSGKFSGMINTLTEKLSNVSKVAQGFAGTLQTDVLNAMAQAASDTTRITTLTDNYTKALENNEPSSNAVKQAQDALTSALNQYGFKTTDITQMENILTQAFGRNQDASSTLKNQTDVTRGAFEKLSSQYDIDRGKANDLFDLISGKGNSTFNILHNQTDLSRTKFEQFASQLGITKGQADDLFNALHRLPPNTSVVIHESGIGKWSVSGSTSQTGVAHGPQNIGAAPGGAQQGMLIPGYGGGDRIPILAEAGEAVVPKHLVKAIAPFLAANKVPGFTAGGIIPGYSGDWKGMPAWTDENYQATIQLGTNYLEKAMNSAMQAATASAAGLSIPGAGGAGYAAFRAAAIKALQITGTPMSWLNDLAIVAEHESGFNPNAINLTDSNAAAGDPSRGLMQTIMSTFLANHVAGTSFNIYNPVANIAAAIEYIKRAYGSVFNVPGILSLERGGGYVGYDSGGLLMPGLTLAYNGTGAPEKVLSPAGGGEGTIHTHVYLDGKEIWTNQQKYTLQYNMRNQGKPTGSWAPNTSSSPWL